MPTAIYHFDWDPAKDAANLRKHRVSFKSAISVLHDPFALTRYDDDHGADDERWVSMGKTTDDALLVVVHTFEEWEREFHVRIISARFATARERQQYESSRYMVKEPHVMRNEYDFSAAERGKFYRKDARFNVPIHLDSELLEHLAALAAKRGVPVNELASELLKRDVAEMEAT